MAEKRAAFSLRRRRSLGFSKCRLLRTTFNVPSRSTFFFNRRRALSTGSPFFSLISVKSRSHPLQMTQVAQTTACDKPLGSGQIGYFSGFLSQSAIRLFL